LVNRTFLSLDQAAPPYSCVRRKLRELYTHPNMDGHQGLSLGGY
jgi:hypothetical protein